MPCAQSCALSPLGTCMTTACKPRETKSLQEKNYGYFWLPGPKQPQHCWASTGGEGQACVTNRDSAMAPASAQPPPGTDSLLGYCSEALERPQRYQCYSWAAPQWPALVFPNLSSKPLKSSGLLVFSWENLSNTWTPMFIYKILPLLQLLQKFHPSARFLFRLYSSIWWTEIYWINRNKPQECPHPGAACVAWDSFCSKVKICPQKSMLFFTRPGSVMGWVLWLWLQGAQLPTSPV